MYGIYIVTVTNAVTYHNIISEKVVALSLLTSFYETIDNGPL